MNRNFDGNSWTSLLNSYFFPISFFVQFLIALGLPNGAQRPSKMFENRSKTATERTKCPKWTPTCTPRLPKSDFGTKSDLPSSKKWSKMTPLASQNDSKAWSKLRFLDAESSIRIILIFECNSYVTCLLCRLACLLSLACFLAFACLLAISISACMLFVHEAFVR